MTDTTILLVARSRFKGKAFVAGNLALPTRLATLPSIISLITCTGQRAPPFMVNCGYPIFTNLLISSPHLTVAPSLSLPFIQIHSITPKWPWVFSFHTIKLAHTCFVLISARLLTRIISVTYSAFSLSQRYAYCFSLNCPLHCFQFSFKLFSSLQVSKSQIGKLIGQVKLQ